MFQIISKNNDSNGNASRLILVYSTRCMSMGDVIECCFAQSSRPNRVNELEAKGLKRLPDMHLAPKEFNALKALYTDMLTHSH